MPTEVDARLAGPAFILFADLVGSSELSEYMSPAEYAETVRSFHGHAESIARAIWLRDPACLAESRSGYSDALVVSGRGDEVCLISSRLSEKHRESDFNLLVSGEYGDWIMRNLLAVIKFSLALKAAWLLGKYNLDQRILRGRLPLDMAVGIHFGSVVFMGDVEGLHSKPGDQKLSMSDFVGYAINLAKRIEGTGREGIWTSIMASPEVRYFAKQFLPDVLFHVHKQIALKGIIRPPQIGEIREVLFSEFFTAEGWKIETEAGVRKVADALTTLTDSHVELLGLRFLCASALECCGLACDALVSESKLIQDAIQRAARFDEQGRTDWCYQVLEDFYPILEGHPLVEELLSRSAVVAKPAMMVQHAKRAATQRTSFFSRGSWKKQPEESGLDS